MIAHDDLGNRGAVGAMQIEKAKAPTNTLALLLPPGWPDLGGEISWWWADARGIVHAGRVSDLAALPAEARGARLRVWTPGMETLLTHATLPTRSRAKILQALPFALEEQLLGEPEGLHFAYQPMSDGRLAVAVTARERLNGWLAGLNGAGLHPITLCPAPLSVPLMGERWSAVFALDEIWLRTGPFSGLATISKPENARAIFVSALNEAKREGRAPEELVLFNVPLDLDTQAWALALDLPMSSQALDLGASLLETPPLNLLQSDYASTRQWTRLAVGLRPAAIMLALWLVGSLGFSAFEWFRLSHAAETQRAQMTTLFRQSFPDAKVVVDPALQMQRNLASLRAHSGALGAGDFLPLLAHVAPALQSTAQAQLQGMQYTDGAITLEVTAPSFQALDALKNNLRGAGLKVEVLAANSGATGVEGRIRVGAS